MSEPVVEFRTDELATYRLPFRRPSEPADADLILTA